MKRTLLAVGIAILVSMMLAPHGDKSSVEGWGPFFYSDGYFVRGDVGFWWYSFNRKNVMIDMLALEIVFLAVLFSVVANIRWRRKWAFIILTAFVGVVAIRHLPAGRPNRPPQKVTGIEVEEPNRLVGN